MPDSLFKSTYPSTLVMTQDWWYWWNMKIVSGEWLFEDIKYDLLKDEWIVREHREFEWRKVT
jgi:hypothetical protein